TYTSWPCRPRASRPGRTRIAVKHLPPLPAALTVFRSAPSLPLGPNQPRSAQRTRQIPRFRVARTKPPQTLAVALPAHPKSRRQPDERTLITDNSTRFNTERYEYILMCREGPRERVAQNSE